MPVLDLGGHDSLVAVVDGGPDQIGSIRTVGVLKTRAKSKASKDRGSEGHIATPCMEILSSLYGETGLVNQPGVKRWLRQPQTDRSRLIIASEFLSPIGGGVINHHHLEVRIIQLLDGRQGIGFQSVLPVLGANDDRYEWRHVFEELDDLNDNKRSANAGPAGRYMPVDALTDAEIVSRNSPAPCPTPQVWARLDDEWPPDGTREVLDR